MIAKLYRWVQARQETEEEGQSLAEYGLILALVAVVAIGALTVLGSGISNILNQVAGAL